MVFELNSKHEIFDFSKHYSNNNHWIYCLLSISSTPFSELKLVKNCNKLKIKFKKIYSKKCPRNGCHLFPDSSKKLTLFFVSTNPGLGTTEIHNCPVFQIFYCPLQNLTIFISTFRNYKISDSGVYLEIITLITVIKYLNLNDYNNHYKCLY